MILEKEQENFVEVCTRHVHARYGEMRAKKVHRIKQEIRVRCCYAEAA